MVETFIFGHKSPDSDSITSSIVMTNLEKELGNSEAKAYRLGNINKETEFILNYLDMDAPELLESVEDDANVILVDHNSPAESVDNLENANILKVVDHHKLALETSYPLFLRFEPVGCTETILCKLYEENGIEITKEIATLMLSAIISDTLLLKSPTTTDDDVKAIALTELSSARETPSKLKGLGLLCGNIVSPTATVKLEIDGVEKETSNTGVGPIDASLNAIRDLIQDTMDIELEEYNLEAVNGGTDALADVFVISSDNEGNKSTGRAIKDDVVMASILAVLDSINKLLLIKRSSDELNIKLKQSQEI